MDNNSTLISRLFTWRPDVPDYRDFPFSVSTTGNTPVSADLRQWMPPVEDQLSLGSCTGCAVAGAIEFLERRSHNRHTDVSRLFLYYHGREAIRSVQHDSGATLRDVVKSAHKVGVCKEDVWRYQTNRFKVKPSAAAYKDALTRRISSYQRISSLAELKTSLASNIPVVFGFAAYSSLVGPAVATHGQLNLPTSGERFLGGHAVLAVGYNDITGRVLVRNSWGNQWGQGGYFTMPYEYLASRALSDDFWAIAQ